ncbi:hypothetical protein TNCV_1130871 [Trichonephila clavipes]|nr:hypothetical protein TNCV_1130871 [Trichonephila clavipes]
MGQWVEHLTPDKRALVRCPMPPNTLRVHTEYVLVKSVGPKVLWAKSRVQGTGEYFLLLQTHGKIVEVEIGDVVIYCVKVQRISGSGNFHSFPLGRTQQRQVGFLLFVFTLPAFSCIVALLFDSIKTSEINFFTPGCFAFSDQRNKAVLLCSVLVEATDGDRPVIYH